MKKKGRVNQKSKIIMENIERIKWEKAYLKNEMNMTTNDFLIDSLIYRLKALDREFQYYIAQAREEGVMGFEKIS